MYVEADFLLALAKANDWLQPRAMEALDEYEYLETSILSFAELLLISDRFAFDRTRAVANLLELVSLKPESDQQIVLKAATYQDEHGATTFDALNAAIAETRDQPVLSSEQFYDEIGIERVPLEPSEEDDGANG